MQLWGSLTLPSEIVQKVISSELIYFTALLVEITGLHTWQKDIWRLNDGHFQALARMKLDFNR